MTGSGDSPTHTPSADRSPAHILTVNLEDYFQVKPLSGFIPRGHWPRFERRAEGATRATLDLLDQMGALATFFVSGWIAEAAPGVVRDVVARGHEIACKGFAARSLRDLTREQFREDARRAKGALEDAAGLGVQGYRLARDRLTEDRLWVLDILAEEGFVYDSSVRIIGYAGDQSTRYIHQIPTQRGSIWEVPVSTTALLNFCLPIGGGNWVRHLPHPFVARAIELESRRPYPLVLYFHIWELDFDQPRIAAVPWLQRVRQYRNLDKMQERLRYYLSRYHFTTARDRLGLPVPAAVAPRAVAAEAIEVAGPRPTVAITLVVPCYNEEAALPYLANTLRVVGANLGRHYLVSYVFVDDGSKDGTWEKLQALFAGRADCLLIRHPQNRGVAAATLTGIHAATTEIVCAIDCDCTYDPEQLIGMIPMLTDDVGLVTASPYHHEGTVVNVAGWRLFLSKGLSLLYRFVLGQRIATYTSCFRVYRRSEIAKITVHNGHFVGVAEILARLVRNGVKVVEYPAVLESRILGQSKMRVLRVILGHLQLLTRLLLDRGSDHDGVSKLPTQIEQGQR